MALPPCPTPGIYSRLFSRFFAALLLTFNFILLTPTALATSYQQCQIGQTCRIGEFLYQDDYSILTGATCTLTARDPAGVEIISGAGNMTGNADGWYEYAYDTTGADEGLYRATICCNDGTDDMCLDKSFELKTEIDNPTAGEIADAVLDEPVAGHTGAGTLGGNLQNESFTVSDIWNNPTRTLSSFGSLAGDVWSYSTRSLSTFGTLIANIWENPDRTLTESTGGTTTNTVNNVTNNSTSSNPTNNNTYLTNNAYTTVEGGSSEELAGLKRQLDEQRKLLEVLVNEPIIVSSIDEGAAPDLQEKLAKSREATDTLYSLTQTVRSRLSSLERNWNTIGKSAALEELRFLSKSLGGQADKPTENSIISHTGWLEESWANPLTADADSAGRAALNEITVAIKNTEYYGPEEGSLEFLNKALASLDELENVIGSGSDPDTAATLFGHIKKVGRRAQLLDDQSKSLNGLLSQMPELSLNDLSNQTSVQEKQILSMNEFGYALTVLKSKVGDTSVTLKNKLYSLRALIDINKSLLAVSPKNPIRSTWLEEGSIIFRTVITNPSKIVSQTVPLKYYLPRELKEDNIIDRDPGLKISYDPDHQSLVAEGIFELGPEEAVIVYVEADDIWIITKEELDNYSLESDTLMASLKDSPNLGAAAEIKSGIDKIIGKIAGVLETSKAPADRIRTYRESQLELMTVQENLQELKNLVASEETASSITGFIGGSQAILAWGLIAIFLAGFAFLTLYMKSLTAPAVAKSGVKSTAVSTSLVSPLPHTFSFSLPRHIAFPLVIVVFALVTIVAGIAIFNSRKPVLQAPVTVPIASVAPSLSPSPLPSPSPSTEPRKLVLGKSAEMRDVIVPEGGAINLRSGAGTAYPVVIAFKATTPVYVFEEGTDDNGESWSRVGLSPSGDSSWWVMSSFLE